MKIKIYLKGTVACVQQFGRGSQTRARLGSLKFWREIQTRPLRGLLAFQEHKDNRSLFDGMALLWRWKVIVYLSIAIG